MDTALISLIVIVALALAFDFINGFHDTANAIATSVATRVLTPAQAIAMSAILNVVGALMGTHVAKTVSKDIVSQDYATLELVGAALIIEGASRLGIPVSTTHTISTAIMGVGTTKGFRKVKWQVAGKIVQAWIFTIPTCIALGWLCFKVADLFAR